MSDTMTPAAGPGTSTETAEAGPENLAPRPPPRERIVKAARDLFYTRGVRAVGVEEIAEAAGTNKMTLYRHFASKDELVAECLRVFARQADGLWDALAAAHPDDPRAELSAWLEAMTARIIAADALGAHAGTFEQQEQLVGEELGLVELR